MPLTKLEIEHLSPKTYESVSPTEPLCLHTDMIKCGVIIACKRDTDTYIHIHTYIHTYRHIYTNIYDTSKYILIHTHMYWRLVGLQIQAQLLIQAIYMQIHVHIGIYRHNACTYKLPLQHTDAYKRYRYDTSLYNSCFYI